MAASLFSLTRNQTIYSPNKSDVSNKIDSIVKSYELSQKQLIYAKTEDKGCKESNVGWLGKSTQCSLQNYKIYKNNKSASVDIKEADSIIQQQGFKYKNGSLAGDKTSTVSYESNDGIVARLIFYKPDQRGVTASGYFQVPIETSFATDEYALGISLYASYWSCTEDNWLKPCPAPPSE